MHRIAKYGLLFIVSVLLQVFLFDNLNLSPYLCPLVYAGFIVLLPANLDRALLLALSFALGLSVDLLSGTAGLHTIAATATGFLRPALLRLTVDKDAAREGFMPLPLTVGRAKWLRYAAAVITLHCTLYFLFEAMSFRYIAFTLLRIAGSATTTLLLVWFAANLLPGTGRSGTQA